MSNNKRTNIFFNSIISICLVTDSSDKKKSLYIMREESLDETIFIQQCNLLADFCLIKESLFVIKSLEESNENDDNDLENDSDSLNKDVLYNQHFYLQHMVSKKYLAKMKQNGQNSYLLKLEENQKNAIPFTFKKIVDTRGSKSKVEFNQILYLSVYIKEKNQYFYVNQSLMKTQNINNVKSQKCDIVVEKDFDNKFIVINQSYFGSNDSCIYSGDLVNIIFRQNNSERKLMMGVECQKDIKSGEKIPLKEVIKEDIENFENENNKEKNDRNDLKRKINILPGEMTVKCYNLENEYFDHLNNLAFWVIEDENFMSLAKLKRHPLESNGFVFIKNPMLNLYLKIRKRPKKDEEGNEIGDKYEFELCNKDDIMKITKSLPNFQITHYSINVENKSLTDGGKYIIQNLFQINEGKEKEKIIDTSVLNSYYEPICFEIGHDDRILVGKKEEFVIEIKKVNIFKGNEVIYLKHIIEQLDYDVKDFIQKGDSTSTAMDKISKNFKFFTSYLMNLDYSFKDINLETNYPVASRQNLLKQFKILDIINHIISCFLPGVKPNDKDQKNKNEPLEEKNDQNSEALKDLMRLILTFLIYLSQDNEEIKQDIFCDMKDILELCENLFIKDRTLLLDFVFFILKGSSALQDSVLGSNSSLIKEFQKRQKSTDIIDDKNLIKIDKIFSYIETSQNFLNFYKKNIAFDKFSLSIKSTGFNQALAHMKHVEEESKNPNSENYLAKLNKRIENVKNTLKEFRSENSDMIIIRQKEKEGTWDEDVNILRKEIYKIKDILRFLRFFKKFNYSQSLDLRRSFYKYCINKKFLSNNDKNNLKIVDFNNNNDNDDNNKDLSIKQSNNNIINTMNLNDGLNKSNNTFLLNNINEDDKNDIIKEEKEGNNIKNSLDKKLNFIIYKDIEPKLYLGDICEHIRSDVASIFPITCYQDFFKGIENHLEDMEEVKKIRDRSKESVEESINYSGGEKLTFNKNSSNIKNNSGLTKKNTLIGKNIAPELDLSESGYDEDENQKDTDRDLESSEYIDKKYQEINKRREGKKEDEKISDSKKKNEEKIKKEIMHKDLCIIYTTFQFCINQYLDGIHYVYKNLKILFINDEKFANIEKIKDTLNAIRKILFRKIQFYDKNSTIAKMYESVSENATIFNDCFNEINNSSLCNEEIYNIKFLFKCCKKFDKINFLLEKFQIFSYITKLNNNRDNYNSSSVDIYLLNNILNKFTEKRKDYLSRYQQLNKEKEDLIANGIFNTGSIKAYIIQGRSKFVTKILGKYEISYFFDKIIYIQNETFLNDFKHCNDEIKSIEEELLKIKKEENPSGQSNPKLTATLHKANLSDKELNNNTKMNASSDRMDDPTSKQEERFITSIKRIIRSLEEINKFLRKFYKNQNQEPVPESNNNINNNNNNSNIKKSMFTYNNGNNKNNTANNYGNNNINNANSIVNKNNANIANNIESMLQEETITYLRKINFPHILDDLIEEVNSFKSNKKLQDLGIQYNKEILKLLKTITNSYPKFYKLIENQLTPYFKLISESINILGDVIKNIPVDNEKDKKREIVLSTLIYGFELFYYLIKTSKKTFSDLKKIMTDIIKMYFLLFENIPKDLYINYYIFYTYWITRILLLLNKTKGYDFYHYDDFFKTIYPPVSISNKVKTCLQHLYSQDKEKPKSNVYNNKEDADNDEDNQDENDMRDGNDDYKDDENYIRTDNENINEDEMETPESNEKMKTLICINFLSIYTIYLNELNSVRQGSSSDKGIINFKFKNIHDKVNNILNPSISKADSSKMGETMLDSSLRNTQQPVRDSIGQNNTVTGTLLTEGNGGQRDGIKVNNNFEFESILLESIIYYKNRKKVLEVRVERKDENATNDIKNYKYFYYNTEFIDLILIEKIIRNIKIKEDIQKIFDEEYTNDNENTLTNSYDKTNFAYLTPMDKLIEYRKDFNCKMAFAIQEPIYHDILHDQYIKDDLLKYLESVIKTFNSLDNKEIEAMKYYNFIKINEMYQDQGNSDDLSNANNSNNNSKQDIENNHISLVKKLILLDKNNYESNENNDNNDLNNANEVDLNKIFSDIMYLYPQNDKRLTILIYKTAFNLLLRKCNEAINKGNENPDLNFEKIIISLNGLFKREKNQEILKEKELYFIVLKAITIMLLYLQKFKMTFVAKNSKILKSFFTYIDFIFSSLAKNLIDMVKFTQIPESQKISEKFNQKTHKLTEIIDFINTVLKFNGESNANLLNDKIKQMNINIVEQVINLIFILLEFNNKGAKKTILLLLEFLNNFINGPNIENLNLLFKLKFFDLMKKIIKNIDYYKIILKYINKEQELENEIKLTIEIEYKIMNIFFIYFNIALNDKKYIQNYINVRKFYDDNIEYIKNKLKKLYYIIKQEINNEPFDIDKDLLFYNHEDFYNEDDLTIRAGLTDDEIDNINKAKEKSLYGKISEPDIVNNKSAPQNASHHSRYIIKFEIILTYYTLYILQREVIDEIYYNVKKVGTNIIVYFSTFVKQFIYFCIELFKFPVNFFRFLVRLCSKSKDDRYELFKRIYNIDEEYLSIDENEMMDFMKNNIGTVELSLGDIIYKVYFPILSKSKKIRDKPDNYIHVSREELANYFLHVLNNYDVINVEATQGHLVDKIFKLPILSLFFENLELIKGISIISGFITNFFILASYSIFNDGKENCKGKKALYCPSLMWRSNKSSVDRAKDLLWGFGILKIILTCILAFDYYIRNIFSQIQKCQNDYKLERFKSVSLSKNVSCMGFFKNIILLSIKNSFINGQSCFYILSLLFLVLGIKVHYFFYGFMLCELMVRIDIMKNVLMAMYEPLNQIVITLIMFLILIYYFSLFAVRFFTSHFPNNIGEEGDKDKLIDDTKYFYKVFMRMFDQTFKQDGGVGTYLDQSLDSKYVPYIYPAYMGVRFWYDNIFFYIIIMLIFQMFLSIIKDYFSNQRENQKLFQDTFQTLCLICKVERETLEKIYSDHKNAFDIHINHEHSVSDYICYLNYLQSTTDRDQIIEGKVWKMHLKNDYFFIPKNSCFKLKQRKCLEGTDEDKKDDDES